MQLWRTEVLVPSHQVGASMDFRLGLVYAILLTLANVHYVVSLPTDRSEDLFTSNPTVDTSNVAGCDGDDVISCVDVTVNPDAINASQIMVEGVRWTKVQPLQDGVKDESYSAEFSSREGSNAVFTVRGGHMFGSVQMANGSVYLLENCGDSCHVWMEMDTDQEEEDDDEVDHYEEPDNSENRDTFAALQNQGKEDETTIVEISVMIYYTPEFAAETPDVQTYVDAVIAETNEGYKNSQIPVRVKVHCIELAEDLHDIEDEDEDGNDMIDAFEAWGGSNIRRSADAAALLVVNLDICGVGFLGAYRYNYTITVSKKSCALGRFTFGHELGHNFGTNHDREHRQNSIFSYGFGKHIGPGYRTIMAYDKTGYGQKANYYSNPNVQFMGHDTGSADEDNARVITENRFVFAAIGDESETCAAPTPAPTTEAPTAIPTSTTMNNECKDGTAVRGKNLKKPKSATDWFECQLRCLSTDGCSWFSYFTKLDKNKRNKKRRGICFLKKNMRIIRKKKGVFSGPKTCYI